MPRKRSIPPADAALRALAEAKLASSGLTLDAAAELNITLHDGPGTEVLGHPGLAYPSLRFAYHDPNGEVIKESGSPIYRLRFLSPPPLDKGAEALTGKKQKALRYLQPSGTAPYPYFPLNQPWAEVLADTSQTLIITEGELKAAKACQEGFPTIGLGGVHSWRSIKRGITWLPHLDQPWVQWAQRKVVICFDSDYQTNPQVCLAIYDLAEQLEARGAYVHLLSLPSLPDVKGKVGLDDFLTFAGATANDQLEELLAVAEPIGLSKPLWAMNERYVYIRDAGIIYERKCRFKTTPTAFTGHLESTTDYWQAKLNSKGELVRAPVSAAVAWLKWGLRTSADNFTYLPGQGEFIERQLNLWPGWGMQPAKGEVAMFLKLLDHLFEGAESGAKEWLLCWLAYPLQKPGTKLFTSVVVHGVKEGTGKSLLGHTVGQLYGKNYSSIGQAELQGGFNEWAAEKQFIMGDDVTGTNRFEQMDLLKKMITQTEIRINQKYIPSYTVPDCINYYFTTNRGDAFMLADGDRRQFIHEVTAAPLTPEFAQAYEKQVLSPQGLAAVFDYLLHVDLSGFSPTAPALRTAAKARMTADVQSDLGAWVRELRDTPDQVTRLGEVLVKKDLFCSKELLTFYDPEEKTRTTANGMARELGRAGFVQVLKGLPVRLNSGKQLRLYIVRNETRWAKCEHSKEVTAHLEEKDEPKKRRKF